MKTKSLILEILLIIFPIIGAVILTQIGLSANNPPESRMTIIMMYLPIAAFYWIVKRKIKSSNHSNSGKIIIIWQYLMLGFYVSSIVFVFLAKQHIIERSVKNVGILWLIWMIVYGNFRFKIEPYFEPAIHFFVADENIQKQAKRFSGKVIFFGGILSLILLLVLPESLVGYVLLVYVFSFFIAPSFYGKILQWRKVV